MTVLHFFDQPLAVTKPYEGYIGTLVFPRAIQRKAREESLYIDFFTPREKLVEIIEKTYPGISRENIHVWTLGGKSREKRIGRLWEEWRQLGVHLVEDGWGLPTGKKAFNESGTYAPTYQIGKWVDEKKQLHLLIVDGYAASAEAIQAASLSPILDLDASLAVFTSRFKLSYEKEAHIIHLDPKDSGFSRKLSRYFGERLDREVVAAFREDIQLAQDAGVDLKKRTLTIDDFFPEKKWHVMAVSGYMLPDPYSGFPGVERVKDRVYRVSVRLATEEGLERLEQSRLVFQPLLNRFMHGEDYQERAVKVSDSGRIRNELQTLCSEALEHFGVNGIRVYFNRISPDVITPANQKQLIKILKWYKKNHPIWFNWLELK
jgi:hypothetical protein